MASSCESKVFEATGDSPPTYIELETRNGSGGGNEDAVPELNRVRRKRERFWVVTALNFVSFLLPTIYITLSKLWIGHIDQSQIATTDVWGYMGIISEVFDEGLPRAAWVTIGDYSTQDEVTRISLAFTLIITQAVIGTIISVTFIGSAGTFAKGFVPAQTRASSLTYIRIAAFSALSATIGTVVINSTRSLDKPDIPLLINVVQVVLNIMLDLIIISWFHVGEHKPTINDQATIRLACQLIATTLGLCYFVWISKSELKSKGKSMRDAKPSFKALKTLIRPGLFAFFESAVRKSIYLWLIKTVTGVSLNYANAWSVYINSEWGFINVPILTLEASSLALIGHAWGKWNHFSSRTGRAKASFSEILCIARPALYSAVLILVIELPLCVLFATFGITPYGRWLGASETAVEIATHMWRTTGWCYIFWGLTVQLSTILLATKPKWYMYATFISVLLYQLPWAIALQLTDLREDNAWMYHGLVFGGSLIFGFVVVSVVDCAWACRHCLDMKWLKQQYIYLRDGRRIPLFRGHRA